MFERDYLMRMLLAFYEAIVKSVQKGDDEDDPKEAADLLEEAIGSAVDMDGATLLTLAPESIAGVLQVSGTDPRVTEYIARSLLLASGYLAEAGEGALAGLRAAQARALADAYGFALPDDPADLTGLAEAAGVAEDADADGDEGDADNEGYPS